MTENLAGRGEGLAGALDLLEKCRPSHFDFSGALVHHEKPSGNELSFDPSCPKCVIPKAITLIRAALEAAAPPSTRAGQDFEQLVWRANDLLERAKEAMECDPEADNVGGDCWTWIKQTEIWLEEVNREAALATPSPQAPTCICKRVLDCPVHGEQSNAFSTTSAREQSSATASDNLSMADLDKAPQDMSEAEKTNYDFMKFMEKHE